MLYLVPKCPVADKIHKLEKLELLGVIVKPVDDSMTSNNVQQEGS